MGTRLIVVAGEVKVSPERVMGEVKMNDSALNLNPETARPSLPRAGRPAGFSKDHFPTRVGIPPSPRMGVSPYFPEVETQRRRQRPLRQHYLEFQPAVARPFAVIGLPPGDSPCNEYSWNKPWVTRSLIHMCCHPARVVSRRLP